MSFNEMHKSRRCAADAAVDCLRRSDRVIVPTGVGEPPPGFRRSPTGAASGYRQGPRPNARTRPSSVAARTPGACARTIKVASIDSARRTRRAARANCLGDAR
jgi:hypothetical protein